MIYSEEPGMCLDGLIAHMCICILSCSCATVGLRIRHFFFVRHCHVLLFFLANIINCLHLECLSAFDWGSVQFNCITFNRSSSSSNFWRYSSVVAFATIDLSILTNLEEVALLLTASGCLRLFACTSAYDRQFDCGKDCFLLNTN